VLGGDAAVVAGECASEASIGLVSPEVWFELGGDAAVDAGECAPEASTGLVSPAEGAAT